MIYEFAHTQAQLKMLYHLRIAYLCKLYLYGLRQELSTFLNTIPLLKKLTFCTPSTTLL